jgi:hypothetical protein
MLKGDDREHITMIERTMEEARNKWNDLCELVRAGGTPRGMRQSTVIEKSTKLIRRKQKFSYVSRLYSRIVHYSLPQLDLQLFMEQLPREQLQ